jgi:phosphate starvation-inducible membrane PsiE
MNKNIRNKLTIISTYLEVIISAIIILGIVIMAVGLIKDILDMLGLVFDSALSNQYEILIGDALKLVIGIEFVKMLIKHTPESVIEVLLFAIARKLIAGNSTTIELLIGVVAIAILFIIRKFLYSISWSGKGAIKRLKTNSENSVSKKNNG